MAVPVQARAIPNLRNYAHTKGPTSRTVVKSHSFECELPSFYEAPMMNYVARTRYAAIALLVVPHLASAQALYNGIQLPEIWPPTQMALSREPLATPPYLTSPPAVIPI